MSSLLSLMLACATTPSSPAPESEVAAAPESAEQAPRPQAPSSRAPSSQAPSSQAPSSQASAPAITLTDVGLECGPNDAAILRLRAATASGQGLWVDLPSGVLPGTHETQMWRMTDEGVADSTIVTATVTEHTPGHLKAEIAVPASFDQGGTLQVDAEIMEFNDDCG